MGTMTITISGVTPLMMHSDRLANPMDVYSRKLKSLTSKRLKTDEDHEAISRAEFEGGLYYREGVGVYIPARNLFKAIVEGGKLIKKGTAIQRYVYIVEENLPLIYDGPRTPAALYKEGFVDIRTVGNQNARVVRTRPLFTPPWGVTATIGYEASGINPDDIRACIVHAGQSIGLGDYRPGKSGGTFGKFILVEGKA